MSVSIMKLLVPLALWFVKKWIESMGLRGKQLKNYYAFLESIDRHTEIDLVNYVAASNARDATIKRIEERRKQLGIDAQGTPIED